jgi:hypothetical protein
VLFSDLLLNISMAPIMAATPASAPTEMPATAPDARLCLLERLEGVIEGCAVVLGTKLVVELEVVFVCKAVQ